MGAVVLLLAGYLASAPPTAFVIERTPKSIRYDLARVHCDMYAPARYYADHEELPGSSTYAAYWSWCQTADQD
jgi:hypothetical protein